MVIPFPGILSDNMIHKNTNKNREEGRKDLQGTGIRTGNRSFDDPWNIIVEGNG